MALPTHITLEVVTPAGLLMSEAVDELIAPGEMGYFGVRPGHAPMLATLGAGEISYRVGGAWHHLTCFWGFCEVLPDKVNVLAEVGERAEDIDPARAQKALEVARTRLKTIQDEAGYAEAHQAYVRAVTRLAVATRPRG